MIYGHITVAANGKSILHTAYWLQKPQRSNRPYPNNKPYRKQQLLPTAYCLLPPAFCLQKLERSNKPYPNNKPHREQQLLLTASCQRQ